MLVKDAVTTKAERRPKVTEGLHLGLPNFWYPILRSEQLGDKPIQVQRFGQRLAVWRDGSRQPRVFEDRCPHRGAPLSQGRVRGAELACAYHGWRFDAAGDCIDMPLEPPDSARRSRMCVKAYAAEDRGGYIWMFYGDRTNVPPLKVPEEIADDAWSMYKTDYVWDTNWLNILDNVLDPLHAIHLHAGAVTQRKRAKFKNFEITQDHEAGFRLGKVGYRGDGSVGPVEGEVEFLLPNLLRLDIADGTQQGLYRVVIMSTPIDAGHVCAFYLRGRRARGWRRLAWALWWLLHQRAVHNVAAQDRDIMSGMAPIGEARLHEHLVSSDVGVMRLRKRLNQAFFGPTGSSE